MARPQRFTLVIARTAAELDAVYRLRHDIYVSQMGLLPADHPYCHEGRLRDPYDARSQQYLLLHDGEAVGTLRATEAGQGSLEIERYRPIDAHCADRAQAAELTRFMVKAEWRCPMATAMLLCGAAEHLMSRGITEIYGAGKLGSLGRYYRALGARMLDPTPFAYELIPGCRYQLIRVSLGAPGSWQRLRTRLWSALVLLLGTRFPALANRVFKRGQSARSRARVRPEAHAS
ncbi:MAG: GNAT family N-acetyltransferase [Myxococcales bacterium]|nr:GNAT family N-acetyltransferase [Myxococcales bacterium]